MKKYFNWALTILMGLLLTVFFWACTKEVPKEMLNTNKQTTPPGNQQMPNDSIHKNMSPHGNNQQDQTGMTTNDTVDTKAEKITKEADDADTKYTKTKSDGDKKAAVEKQMAAANYLMFEADLTPKKKYRPALKRYNRVLELDPSNKEAAANKKQIEDIYQQMGMPIPN